MIAVNAAMPAPIAIFFQACMMLVTNRSESPPLDARKPESQAQPLLSSGDVVSNWSGAMPEPLRQLGESPPLPNNRLYARVNLFSARLLTLLSY